MAGQSGGTAAFGLNPRERRWIGLVTLTGGLALAVVAGIAWFSAVTVPDTYDDHGSLPAEDRGGGISSCPAPFDVIGAEVVAGCEEPLAARRLVAVAATFPAGLFLVVGSATLRTVPSPAEMRRSATWRRRLPAISRRLVGGGVSVLILLTAGVTVGAARRDAAGQQREDTDEAHGLTVGAGFELLEEPGETAPPDLSDEPLWRSDEIRLDMPHPPMGIEFRGDDALLSYLYGADFAVVDAETGAVRWTADDIELPGGAVSPLIGDSGTYEPVNLGSDEWALLVEYLCDHECAQENTTASGWGVAALAADGQTMWATTVAEDEYSSQITGAAADGETVVLEISPSSGTDDGEQAPPEVTTMAFDTADGRPRWEVDDLDVVAVAGDTVLLEEWSEEEDSDDDAMAASVVPVDAATGEVREDLLDLMPSSRVFTTVGDVAVFQTALTERVGELVALDLTNSRQIAHIGTEGDRIVGGVGNPWDMSIGGAVSPESNTCGDDGRSLITCAVVDLQGHRLLVSIDLDRQEVSLADPGDGWELIGPFADDDERYLHTAVERVLPGQGGSSPLTYGYVLEGYEAYPWEMYYVGLDREGERVDLTVDSAHTTGLPGETSVLPLAASEEFIGVMYDAGVLAVHRSEPGQ